jgi:nucleoside-diphosphate-sugar epimerase
MDFVVTGAQGFLGSKIVTILKKQGNNVTGLTRKDCDLMSRCETSDFFSSIDAHLIIHCAAFVPTSLEEYHDTSLSENNALLLSNILQATSCPVIYISSMTIYGPSQNIIRTESEEPNPQSEYAKSKFLGEQLLHKDGRDCAAIRIPGLFGESRKNGLIFNNIIQLMNSTKLSLPDSPLLWAAMDVQDAAISIVAITKKYHFNGFEAINVGYRDCYSVNLLVDIYSELFDYPIEYDIVHPEFKFDLSKLEKIDAVPKVNLSFAIKKYKGQIC